jgi:hypothetical protein
VKTALIDTIACVIRGRLPCADDSYDTLSLSETDEEQALSRRVADDDLASLASRVILVIEDPCQGIGEDVIASWKETP